MLLVEEQRKLLLVLVFFKSHVKITVNLNKLRRRAINIAMLWQSYLLLYVIELDGTVMLRFRYWCTCIHDSSQCSYLYNNLQRCYFNRHKKNICKFLSKNRLNILSSSLSWMSSGKSLQIQIDTISTRYINFSEKKTNCEYVSVWKTTGSYLHLLLLLENLCSKFVKRFNTHKTKKQIFILFEAQLSSSTWQSMTTIVMMQTADCRSVNK